jgi:predicted porin
MERGGYVSSSDFGLGVDGNWKKDLVNMQVGIYNGENYNKGTGDQRKDAMGRVSVRVLETDDGSRVGGLRLTGYGQVGKPTGGGIRDRWLGMVSYRSKMLTLAAEYARTKDRQDAPAPPATPQLTDINGQVLSFFGVLKIPNSRAAVIGRVDVTDPNRDVANNKQTRFIGGVSYQLTPALRLLADVDNVGFEGNAPIAPAVYATKTQGYFQAQFVF